MKKKSRVVTSRMCVKSGELTGFERTESGEREGRQSTPPDSPRASVEGDRWASGRNSKITAMSTGQREQRTVAAVIQCAGGEVLREAGFCCSM